MKKTLFLSFLALLALFTSCNDDTNEFNNDETQTTLPEDYTRADFPEDDGSSEVPGQPHEKVARLLMNVNAVEATDTLGRANITPQQYAEIKAFADELVKGTTTQYDAFIKCYEWVSQNVKYEMSDNDPYAVFINRKGVCQGYANLFDWMNAQVLTAPEITNPRW